MGIGGSQRPSGPGGGYATHVFKGTPQADQWIDSECSVCGVLVRAMPNAIPPIKCRMCWQARQFVLDCSQAGVLLTPAGNNAVADQIQEVLRLIRELTGWPCVPR